MTPEIIQVFTLLLSLYGLIAVVMAVLAIIIFHKQANRNSEGECQECVKRREKDSRKIKITAVKVTGFIFFLLSTVILFFSIAFFMAFPFSYATFGLLAALLSFLFIIFSMWLMFKRRKEPEEKEKKRGKK